jgi:hypothetical protein
MSNSLDNSHLKRQMTVLGAVTWVRVIITPRFYDFKLKPVIYFRSSVSDKHTHVSWLKHIVTLFK